MSQPTRENPTTIMADYREIPAPPVGMNPAVDDLAWAVCAHGGHLPNFRPSHLLDACDFHRRMAYAYIRVVDNARGAA